MKEVVGALNQEKALVRAFSLISKPPFQALLPIQTAGAGQGGGPLLAPPASAAMILLTKLNINPAQSP